jgi:hypothetical protein
MMNERALRQQQGFFNDISQAFSSPQKNPA